MKKNFFLENLKSFVRKSKNIKRNFKNMEDFNFNPSFNDVKFFKIRKKLKISQKLHLLCTLAISMNVIMLIIILGALHSAEQRMDSFYHVEYKNSIQQMQIRNDVASLDHAILSAVFSEDYQESNQVAEQAVQKTVADINILKKSFFDEQLMKELNTALNDFLTQEMKVMSYAFAGQTDKALDAIHGDYSQCVNNLYSNLDTVSVKAEDAANLALKATVQQRQQMTMLLIVSMVTLGILLLLTAGMLEKTIRKATHKILHIADHIEKGHLNISDEKHTSGDELDEVICVCEQMTYTLQTLIMDVGCMLEEMAKGNMVYHTLYREYYVGDYQSLLTAAENMQSYINYALNNVDAATQKVEKHVKGVSVGAQQLSAHAEEQDEFITQLSDTLNEISYNANHNAAQIQKMNQLVMQMNEQVGTTRQHMSETTSAIVNVTAQTSKIKKIIHTVDEIAFQTEILALNAAIEAARAGDAGRGFSVVAGEVRALAQKVAEAAKETAQLIDHSLQLTNKCGNIVTNTADSLDFVVERTNEITQMISKVTQTVQNEQEDIKNISNEAENIRHIVRINTETAKQFAYGSEVGYQQVNILKQQMLQFVRQEEYADGTEKLG